MSTRSSSWLAGKYFDSLFIIGPSYLATLLALLFSQSSVSPLAWLFLVVGLDVTHVYATIFRTYADSVGRRHFRKLLISIPLACWLMGFSLYLISAELFWSILAYLAVIHFVRQQYGFMMLYCRGVPLWKKRWSSAAIYASTIVPLIDWHSKLPRDFSWFIEGDFIVQLPAWLATVSWISYVLIILGYCFIEIRDKTLHSPRSYFLFGSMLSWYVGIVALNGDLPFSIANILPHAIPYLALLFLYRRKNDLNDSSSKQVNRWWLFATLALIGLLLLGYGEEALWDAAVWHEHQMLFPFIPQVSLDAFFLAAVVSLLSVPQATHYLLDAFIWRFRNADPSLRKLL